MMELKTENYKFFQHKDCEFFPCHQVKDQDKFNCLFCYCPLYALGTKCGGNFTLMENGCKDCSSCLVPHGVKGYDYVMSKWNDIVKLSLEQSEE